MKRLREAGEIVSELLYPPGQGGSEAKRCYYHLGPEVAAARGLSPRYGEAIRDPQQRATSLAAVTFCTCPETPRPKLLLEEFRALFPGVYPSTGRADEHFRRGDYFIDENGAGTRRLARLVVDVDRAPDKLPTVCAKVIERDAEFFGPFSDEHRYALTLVVPTPTKAARVERLLAHADSPLLDLPVPVKVVALEALLPFLEGATHAA